MHAAGQASAGSVRLVSTYGKYAPGSRVRFSVPPDIAVSRRLANSAGIGEVVFCERNKADQAWIYTIGSASKCSNLPGRAGTLDGVREEWIEPWSRLDEAASRRIAELREARRAFDTWMSGDEVFDTYDATGCAVGASIQRNDRARRDRKLPKPKRAPASAFGAAILWKQAGASLFRNADMHGADAMFALALRELQPLVDPSLADEPAAGLLGAGATVLVRCGTRRKPKKYRKYADAPAKAAGPTGIDERDEDEDEDAAWLAAVGGGPGPGASGPIGGQETPPAAEGSTRGGDDRTSEIGSAGMEVAEADSEDEADDRCSCPLVLEGARAWVPAMVGLVDPEEGTCDACVDPMPLRRATLAAASRSISSSSSPAATAAAAAVPSRAPSHGPSPAQAKAAVWLTHRQAAALAKPATEPDRATGLEPREWVLQACGRVDEGGAGAGGDLDGVSLGRIMALPRLQDPAAAGAGSGVTSEADTDPNRLQGLLASLALHRAKCHLRVLDQAHRAGAQLEPDGGLANRTAVESATLAAALLSMQVPPESEGPWDCGAGGSGAGAGAGAWGKLGSCYYVRARVLTHWGKVELAQIDLKRAELLIPAGSKATSQLKVAKEALQAKKASRKKQDRALAKSMGRWIKQQMEEVEGQGDAQGTGSGAAAPFG